MDIPSSVYEWEFTTGFGTTSINNNAYSSCEERSNALNTCTSTLMCPNSPGKCSFNSGGATSTLVEDGCTAGYCNGEVGECGAPGNDCDYSNYLGRCAYLTGGGSTTTCDLAQEVTLTLSGESQTYTQKCVSYNGAGHWQIETSQSCPEGWVSIGGNKCVDSVSPVSPTCEICDSGGCFNDGDGDNEGVCASEEKVCPEEAECKNGDCVSVESEVCECCCRIGNNPSTGNPYAQQDCCSFWDPASSTTKSLSCEGDCGSDTTGTDEDIYGHCSGCRIDEDGDGSIDASEQKLSDQACNCSDVSGKYCQVNADPDKDGDPEGVCRDCTTLDSAEACSDHSSTCCVDAESDNTCRGGFGNDSMVAGDSPDLAYCQYYECEDSGSSWATDDPIASSSDKDAIYTSTTTCNQECTSTYSSLGKYCNTSAEDENIDDCDFSICGSPFQCLDESGYVTSSIPDSNNTCGYCCCEPEEGECSSLGTGLNCQEDKSPCTGSNRGLCCGCSEDFDCSSGPPESIGCGSDSCCRSRPNISTTTPAHDKEKICANTKITAEFDSQMDINSFTGNVIVAGEYEGSCPDDTTYLASKKKEVPQRSNIFAQWWENIKYKLRQGWQRLASLFTGDAYADPDHNYCAVTGSVSGNHLANGNTELIFTPEQVLDTDTTYYVIIKGDENLDSNAGVLSYWEIGMNADGNSPNDNSEEFNGKTYPHSYIWYFTTLEDQGNDGLCEVDHVEIEPESYLFTTHENSLQENDTNPDSSNFDIDSSGGYDKDKVFRAIAKASSSQSLASIDGVYDWDWNWSILNEEVVNSEDNPFTATSGKILISADQKTTNGQSSIISTLNINNSPDAYNSSSKQGTSSVWVFLCNNPWPPFDGAGTWSPWDDNNYNYEFYYCRDSGQKGITADDLPAVVNKNIASPDLDYVEEESYFFREGKPEISNSSDSIGLTANSGTDGESVELEWDNNWNIGTVKEYKIYYGTQPGPPYNNSESSEDTSLTVSGLKTGQKYYFAVTAVSGEGAESDYSQEATVIPEDSTINSDITIKNAQGRDQSAVLSWEDSSSGDASELKIYYKAAACSSDLDFGDSTSIDYQSSGTTTVSGLANGVEYCMGMIAVDEEGNSSGTTTTEVQPFASPESLTVQNVASTSIELGWSYKDDSGDGVDKVKIFRGTSTQDYNWSHTISEATTSYTVSGLTDSTYYFNIKTLNSNDKESVYGGKISVVAAPSAPTINKTIPRNESIDVVWQDNSEGNASEFEIAYKSTSSCSSNTNFDNSMTVSYQSSGTTTISDLTNGEDYCIGMVAKNDQGSISGLTTATTLHFPYPENLTVQDTATDSIELEWSYTYGPGDGVHEVEIFKGTSTPKNYNLGSYKIPEDPPGAPTSNTAFGLSPDTTYYLNIKTVSSSSEETKSEYGGEVSTSTDPIP